jgi:phage N-6-adenine-methyltransferase
LNSISHFQLDAAATETNRKCANYNDIAHDGLEYDWSWFDSVFINPPYSEPEKWVAKAETTAASTRIVMLLRGDTSTAFFHNLCESAQYIHFYRGRLHFNDGKVPAPFASIIAVFGPAMTKAETKRLAKSIAGFGVDLK